MRFFLAAYLLAVVGCQPMYGAKSEPVRTPAKIPHKPEPEPVVTIPYVVDCPTNFRANPIGIQIDHTRSNQLVDSGDSAIAQSTKLPDPEAQAQVVRTGIEQYRQALTKDPYNADATLKLAVAYDRVYRKGCALKLLSRIATLENHPKFRASARRAVDQVVDSAEWFKGYRKEALDAVAGLTPSPTRP